MQLDSVYGNTDGGDEFNGPASGVHRGRMVILTDHYGSCGSQFPNFFIHLHYLLDPRLC